MLHVVMVYQVPSLGFLSTFLVSAIFLLGGVVKKSWPISHFYDQSDQQSFGLRYYASPPESDGDAQQVSSWVLTVAHVHR